MDDDLQKFEADGAAPLRPADAEGHIDHAGARIWYSTRGSGPAVVLLHGALGNSADWGYQVRSLVDAEYLARSIPDAKLIVLPGVSHFAPLQRPDLFNHSMLAFLNGEHERGDASTAGQ